MRIPRMNNRVSFFLNGVLVTVNNPPADMLLLDYLRLPSVGLIGAKKSCGEGGCGSCAVVLSRWNGIAPVHCAINSCLRLICSLGGLSVTTIEGMGGIDTPEPAHLSHANVYSAT